MKKRLVITLIIMTIGVTGLQANILPYINSASHNIVNEFNIDSVDNSANTNYGQSYYRKNSSHRFDIAPDSSLNLDNLNADVKVITWDKKFAEIEIMKVSTLSDADLKDREVLINNDGNLTVSTCCCNPENCTTMKLVVKLPQGVTLGNIKNHQGNLSLKKLEHSPMLCR